MRRNLRVAFLPRYRGNSYQTLLDEHLTELGVSVGNFGHSALSALIGLVHKRPDVVHLHWLDAFFVASTAPVRLLRLIALTIGVRLLKLLGRKLVWTVHNLRDHEGRYPRLDRICTAFVVRHADAIIVHCHEARRLLASSFDVGDMKKIFVIPHGNYCDAYENRISRSAARLALGIPHGQLMLLLFGQIRAYKGVLELIEAFAELECDDALLVIAGKPRDAESSEVIRKRAELHPSISYIPGFVADDEIQTYLNACDAVVLPYRDILTSGAVILAMSFGRACVAPRMGCIGEVLDDEGGFAYDPNAEGALLGALRNAVDRRVDLPAMGEHNRQSIEEWDWDRVGRMTLDVYEHCVGGPTG